MSLPPFGQCRATAWFRPQAEGPAVARFSVVDNGGQVLREGTLTGTGAEALPALAWSGGTPSLVDFGQVTIGQFARRELGLINTSQMAVIVSTLRVTGPNASRFTLEAVCAPTGSLEAGAACALTLGFAPTSAGRAEGWIEVVSDATNAPLVRIAAAGVAAVAEAPVAAAPEGGGGGALSTAWLAMLVAAVVALGMQRRR